MNVSNEVEGGRGSQNIAVMYSDSCSGQDRNIKITLSLLKPIQDPKNDIATIDYKVLVSY